MWHFKPEEKISGVELRKRLKLNTMMKFKKWITKIWLSRKNKKLQVELWWYFSWRMIQKNIARSITKKSRKVAHQQGAS